MANKEPGYVYILTNPSFREDWVALFLFGAFAFVIYSVFIVS